MSGESLKHSSESKVTHKINTCQNLTNPAPRRWVTWMTM